MEWVHPRWGQAATVGSPGGWGWGLTGSCSTPGKAPGFISRQSSLSAGEGASPRGKGPSAAMPLPRPRLAVSVSGPVEDRWSSSPVNPTVVLCDSVVCPSSNRCHVSKGRPCLAGHMHTHVCVQVCTHTSVTLLLHLVCFVQVFLCNSDADHLSVIVHSAEGAPSKPDPPLLLILGSLPVLTSPDKVSLPGCWLLTAVSSTSSSFPPQLGRRRLELKPQAVYQRQQIKWKLLAADGPCDIREVLSG